MTTGSKTEFCKFCPGPLTFLSFLSGDRVQAFKGDTGLQMLFHIRIQHPELVGLPSAEEQLRIRQREAYRHDAERRLWERRN